MVTFFLMKVKLRYKMPVEILPIPFSKKFLILFSAIMMPIGLGIFAWAYLASRDLSSLAMLGAGAEEKIYELRALLSFQRWISLDIYAPLDWEHTHAFWDEFHFQLALHQTMGLGIALAGLGGLLLVRTVRKTVFGVLRLIAGGLVLLIAAQATLRAGWAVLRHERIVPRMDFDLKASTDLLYHEYHFKARHWMYTVNLPFLAGGRQVAPDPDILRDFSFGYFSTWFRRNCPIEIN